MGDRDNWGNSVDRRGNESKPHDWRLSYNTYSVTTFCKTASLHGDSLLCSCCSGHGNVMQVWGAGKVTATSHKEVMEVLTILISLLLSTETQLAVQQLPSCHILLHWTKWPVCDITQDNWPAEAVSSTKFCSSALTLHLPPKTLKETLNFQAFINKTLELHWKIPLWSFISS